MRQEPSKVLVIACSGVGKVHGLISRESAYLAVDELASTNADVVCLALLVREDEETLKRVRALPCIAIDGCAKACAKTNVEIAGGKVAQAVQVAKALSDHRGIQPGDGSELTADGWAVTREIAEAVAEGVQRICAGENVV